MNAFISASMAIATLGPSDMHVGKWPAYGLILGKPVSSNLEAQALTGHAPGLNLTTASSKIGSMIELTNHCGV